MALWHSISTDDLDRAKEFLVMDAPRHTIPSSDEEVVDSSLELSGAGVQSIPEPRRPDTYLDPWYPEDATVEVWSPDANDPSSMIPRSLDANRIHGRGDSERRDAKKIFVRPDDESFAREIVREIIESTPLP